MKEKTYFYFADAHTLEYPYYVRLLFKKRNGLLIRRNDRSEWQEAEDYTYYGESVNCIIPAQILEYDFVYDLLDSEKTDNVFGAVNYMLQNYRERFLSEVKPEKFDRPEEGYNFLIVNFGNHIRL